MFPVTKCVTYSINKYNDQLKQFGTQNSIHPKNWRYVSFVRNDLLVRLLGKSCSEQSIKLKGHNYLISPGITCTISFLLLRNTNSSLFLPITFSLSNLCKSSIE